MFDAFIPILIFAAFLAVPIYALIAGRRTDRAFNDFAASHGLTHVSKVPSVPYHGTLPGAGSRLVSGTDNKTGQTVALFYYTHVTGSGKSRREYKRTVVAVPIKPTNSRIFINSRVNDTGEQLNIDHTQRYKAEGDFGKYFDIYAADKRFVEALAIFAPDVMEHLMAHYGFYDLEIVNDVLYIYDYRHQTKQVELEAFYQQALKLATELNTNTPRTLALQAESGQPQPSAVTAFKRPSLGLKTIIFIVFASVFFVPVFLLNSNAGRTVAQTWNLGINLGFLVFILVVAVRRSRRKQAYMRDRQKFVDHLRDQ